MRKMTIAILLALLAVAALAAGCPRDKGDTTSVSIEDEAPADGTIVADAAGDGAADGETNVDVDVHTEGGDSAAEGEGQAEGDAASGETADGDAAAGDADKDAAAGDNAADAAKEDPNVKTVVLETSKGDIVLAVHTDWAPIGVAHFLELVNAGYYNGAPWFRVLPGFVAQCGIAADPKVTAQWQEQTIKDEPVKQGNKRGFVAFGKSGAPNSRSTHIFINLADNTSSLDPQGFSCFAEVTSGMEVVEKLFPADFQDQAALSSGGIDLFKERFPQGDTIIRAFVKE